MNLRTVVRITVATFAAVLLSTAANAQLFRTYVSSAGNDANPCTLPAPCRLLPAALAAVASGGEIWMLNSANYNTATVVINKSVTILAVPGEVGSILGGASPGQLTAVAINGQGINVTLKNVVLRANNVAAIGDIGVLISDAASVTIEDSTVTGFVGPTGSNGVGIWATTGANATAVNVIRSTIRNGAFGIIVEGGARANISKSHIVSNGRTGVTVASVNGTFASASIADTVSSQNENGFVVSSTGQAIQGASVSVTRSVASHNANYGFFTNNNEFALLLVGESMATLNPAGGFVNEGLGVFLSKGNNTTGAAGNSGTITLYAGT